MAEYIIEFPSVKENSNATIIQELIRCRNCKYYSDGYCMIGNSPTGREPYWFCAYGKNKNSND